MIVCTHLKNNSSMNWMGHQCTFKTDPLNMTFCLSGATPDKAKSCALKTSGDSSLSNSTFSNFSRPHFTDTILRSKQTTDYIDFTNAKSGWNRTWRWNHIPVNTGILYRFFRRKSWVNFWFLWSFFWSLLLTSADLLEHSFPRSYLLWNDVN